MEHEGSRQIWVRSGSDGGRQSRDCKVPPPFGAGLIGWDEWSPLLSPTETCQEGPEGQELAPPPTCPRQLTAP